MMNMKLHTHMHMNPSMNPNGAGGGALDFYLRHIGSWRTEEGACGDAEVVEIV